MNLSLTTILTPLSRRVANPMAFPMAFSFTRPKPSVIAALVFSLALNMPALSQTPQQEAIQAPASANNASKAAAQAATQATQNGGQLTGQVVTPIPLPTSPTTLPNAAPNAAPNAPAPLPAAPSAALNTAPSPSGTQALQTAPGVQGVGKMSAARKLVSAEQIEAQAAQQYAQLLKETAAKGALAPANHPHALRLRAIAQKLIPFATRWNERAPQWKWEVNVIGSKQVNAFCMPGGKIAFYTGILDNLKLTDDEVATVMGHEIAHALREHGRERVGKAMATQGVLSIGSALLGLGDVGRAAAGAGANLLSLKFGREDETEGDLVGMDLAARAGFDPRAGVALWQKMGAVNNGAPPAWLSTHPSGKNRIEEIRKHLPEVMPLFAKARGVSVGQLAPYKTNWPEIAVVN